MNEKLVLVDAINGALGPAIEAAIAARNAFIRGAALGNYATIEAGRIAAGLAEQRDACRCFTAMLDQIERAPDEG